MAQQHLVARHVVELDFGSDASARHQADQVMEACRLHAATLLEACLDALSAPDAHIVIPRLEIDLGKLDPRDLQGDFVRKYARALQSTLPGVLAAVPVLPPDQRAEAVLRHYADNGRFPWWVAGSESEVIDQAIGTLFKSRGGAGILSEILGDPNDGPRILRGMQVGQVIGHWERMASLRVPGFPRAVDRLLRHMVGRAALLAPDRRQALLIFAWQALLRPEHALSGYALVDSWAGTDARLGPLAGSQDLRVLLRWLERLAGWGNPQIEALAAWMEARRAGRHAALKATALAAHLMQTWAVDEAEAHAILDAIEARVIPLIQQAAPTPPVDAAEPLASLRQALALPEASMEETWRALVNRRAQAGGDIDLERLIAAMAAPGIPRADLEMQMAAYLGRFLPFSPVQLAALARRLTDVAVAEARRDAVQEGGKPRKRQGKRVEKPAPAATLPEPLLEKLRAAIGPAHLDAPGALRAVAALLEQSGLAVHEAAAPQVISARLGLLPEEADILLQALRTFPPPARPAPAQSLRPHLVLLRQRLSMPGADEGSLVAELARRYLAHQASMAPARVGVAEWLQQHFRLPEPAKSAIQAALRGFEGKPAKPKAPPRARSTTREEDLPLFVDNAGLVIFGPYLPRLFARLGWTEGKAFKDEDSRAQAVLLLRYLAQPDAEPSEVGLELPKVMCGLHPEAEIDPTLPLAEEAIAEADMLTAAVVAHWTSAGKLSPEGLRRAWLRREGTLRMREDHWLLHVAPKGQDALLDGLPWDIGYFAWPWMAAHLYVDWAEKAKFNR